MTLESKLFAGLNRTPTWTLKRGTQFLHAHWLMPDYKTPLLCEVTRVARGTVYYKSVIGGELLGSSWHFDASKASQYVMEIVNG